MPLEPASLRERWWQPFPLRLSVAIVVVLVGSSLLGDLPEDPSWEWHIGSGGYVVFSLPGLAVLLVAAFYLLLMPHASYRKRDVLWLIVPIAGLVVAVKVLARGMNLPRRDWPPRRDELPRAVGLPTGEGAWFLARDFAEAEYYRGRWCTNPLHRHPYDSWQEAQHDVCHPLAVSGGS